MDTKHPGVSVENDGIMLDADFLAARFSLTETQMRGLMARRLVQSRVERGEGEDLGRWRLTVRIGNRVWRGVVAADGALQSESMGLSPARSSDRSPQNP
ncbi:DUF6522 family protein [Aureimonas altamirensis]|jgi:hypothetical protein|uniref:Uncharacterized protein n=1 Tax=Aureimonas altamirensis DSM 21988 TaxID=1121026 RepID=A0ABY1IFR7_9HYPH|nr:DUF6522 family protein [Aureimonas altamirensis]UHD46829.1 DUF6522 family protein [Aureimonas altamirensis]SHJ11132.1 hypothetical protein SAMN02745911_1703 [Aureimonas altamirensis DSM 21988]